MLIKSNRGWELPGSQATPKSLFRIRRGLIKAAADPLLAVPALTLPFAACAKEEREADPSAGLYPVPRNQAFTVEREITAGISRPMPPSIWRTRRPAAP